jgi:hypothetical protein
MSSSSVKVPKLKIKFPKTKALKIKSKPVKVGKLAKP